MVPRTGLQMELPVEQQTKDMEGKKELEADSSASPSGLQALSFLHQRQSGGSIGLNDDP